MLAMVLVAQTLAALPLKVVLLKMYIHIHFVKIIHYTAMTIPLQKMTQWKYTHFLSLYPGEPDDILICC